MSITYTPTTNFGSKDSLPSNDPNKVIRGAEFTTEFTAIQSAFGLAASASNPTFTGTATFDDLTVTNNFTSRGIDDNATSTAITIDASENVGIGTSDPTSGTSSYYDDLVIKNATSGSGAGITIQSNTTNGFGGVDFRKADGTQVGKIYADSAGGQLGLETDGVERIHITSTGDVGIGRSTNIDHILDISKPADAYIRISSGTTQENAGIIFANQNSAKWTLEKDGPAHSLYLKDDSSVVATFAQGGNVGIGTTSPTTKATIAGDVNNSSLPIGSASASDAQLTIANNNASSFGLGSELLFQVATSGSAPVAGIRGSYTGYNASENFSGDLTFGTQANASTGIVDRMTIDSAGNVGIGTDPTFVLDVSGHVGSSVATRSSNTGSALNLHRYENTGASGTSAACVGSDGEDAVVYTSFTEAMRIDSSGNVGIGTSDPNRQLTISETSGYVAAQVASGTREIDLFSNTGSGAAGILTSAGTPIVFYSGNDGEHMRLDNSGNLLVGKTSAGLTVAGCRIQPEGDVRISKTGAAADTMIGFYKNGSGTSVGRIESTSTSTDYITSSDERLKDNITDAPAGNIDSIKVRSFDWKADGSHQEYGFIAQELETVAPYAVSKGETDEDTWGVDYSKLVPLLVKEVQDLKAKVEALENA